MAKIQNGVVVESNGTFSKEAQLATVPASPVAFTQTYSTTAVTVPAATATNAPAGGTGATAGAYDTAANRDLLIASNNALVADVLALRKVVNSLIDILQAAGLAA